MVDTVNRMSAAPLDERLLDVATTILDEEGIERLSLRRIARRAGVSHGAPLRHYPSLAALRSELAARGFALLSASLLEAASERPRGAGPLARLRSAGRAYVQSAIDHPGLFTLMFRVEDLDRSHPSFERESAAAFEHLARLVGAAQDAGWQPERDTRLLSAVVWSALHGLASLWSQGAIAGPVPGASFEDAITTALDLVLPEDRTGVSA